MSHNIVFLVVDESSLAIQESAIENVVVDTVATENEKKQLELEAFKANAVVLLSPGPIVYIFKEITGISNSNLKQHVK